MQTNTPSPCRARKLSDEQRSAIASYFAVYKGQERGVAKLATALDDHPAIARAYALLRDAFEQVGGGVGERVGEWVRGRGSLPVGMFACSCASVLLHLPQL